MDPINTKKPSDDPYYRYLLEVIHGGITHREHFDLLDTSKISVRYLDAKSLIEFHGHSYKKIGEWMKVNGYDREVDKCERMHNKLETGGNIMRRGTIVPKDYIGAFVGHYPMMLTHPLEDRYITYREALSIMGMPEDYMLLNPKQSINHICQNVPVQTAMDMATEVKAYLEGNRETIDSTLTYQYNANRELRTETQNNSSLENFFA